MTHFSKDKNDISGDLVKMWHLSKKLKEKYGDILDANEKLQSYHHSK